MTDPHGLVFEPAAEDYERGRPAWPAELLEGVDADAVLDLAAGTGKLTRLLVRRFPRVVAVEPLPAMRALLERLVPEAEALAGAAEAIPLPDASVGAVFVAEAFHWFDAHAAAAEIARVLRPGGTLLLAFNLWDGPFDPPLPEEARRALDAAFARGGRPGVHRVLAGEWKAGFAGLPFAPLEERRIAREHTADREGVVAYYLSVSSIAWLPAAEREELRAELRRHVPCVAHRLAITTHAFTARRLPDVPDEPALPETA